MISSCTCKHKEQDKLHGKGNRVFNQGTKEYRCTVCGNKKGASK